MLRTVVRLLPSQAHDVRAVKVHVPKEKNALCITFSTKEEARLSSEWLRVNSMASDQRMPGPDGKGIQPVFGKANVLIEDVRPVGNYALSISFSDHHSTGIYSWQWLYDLHVEKYPRMREYVKKLRRLGLSRFPRTGKRSKPKAVVHDPAA
eukprot:EG_transcript_31367